MSLNNETISKAINGVKDKAKKEIAKSKDAVVTAVDVNGDGQIDIEDIIVLGLRTPGIGINRNQFIKKELENKFSDKIVSEAILTTPFKAGISIEDIDKIADEVIKYERNCVSGISAALGMPGGAAMVATIPADIIQYYGYMLRAAQKLMYLYGFPEIDTTEEGQKFDSATLNMLTICLGVMFGVAGANNAIKTVAKAFACGVEKKLVNAALTKGTIYPIVKKVAKWFGVKMTKEVFAGFFKKAIPIVGGIIGGGFTYISFGPCCEKLKKSLREAYQKDTNYADGEKEFEYVIEIDENDEQFSRNLQSMY